MSTVDERVVHQWVSDELWELVAPLIPPPPRRPQGGGAPRRGSGGVRRDRVHVDDRLRDRRLDSGVDHLVSPCSVALSVAN